MPQTTKSGLFSPIHPHHWKYRKLHLMAFQMYHIQTLVAFFRQPAGRVPPWLRQLDNAYQHGCCAVILSSGRRFSKLEITRRTP